MITSKSYHRKTKKGSIVKIVREHYLHDDIHCGKDECEICVKGDEKYVKNKPVIYLESNSRRKISSLFPQSHYVIPDVEVLLHQFDVLEDEAFGNNVIILQTVLNAVKEKNLTVFVRLKDIEKIRRFYILVNEYHRELFVEQNENEKDDEYVQRKIHTTVSWYQKHFSSPKIVLLTNNEKRKQKALDAKLNCFTFMEYVQSLKTSSDLVDKVAHIDDTEGSEGDSKVLFPDHLPLSLVQSGIKSGKYYQSKLAISRNNYLEGYVFIAMKGEDVRVLIKGREHLNRAIHEDIVVIELLPKSQWTSESEILVDESEETENAEIENVEPEAEKMEVETSDNADKKPTGKVVSIVKRNWRQYCGVLRSRNETIMKSMVITSHMFVPSDRRIPFVRIQTRQYDALKNQRIIVAIDSWPKDSRYPKGHYVRAVGDIGDKDTENEVLLIENDVPHLKFTTAVLNCLPPDPDAWTVPTEEYAKRLDLRDTVICSVDPPGCTDIDDALHCKDIGNGLYEIGVHIADVSHFVKPGTAIDEEAANRGTTVYLVDKRIDMIPTVLSSNLCSLLENRERLTFSVIWIMDAKTTEIKDVKFTKSIIKSSAALTYAEAQLKIDSPNMKDELTKSLRRLNSIAKKLKEKRLQNGALILASSGELRFVEIESETHDNVTEIETKTIRETNSMVEEFMLLANVSVAEKIYDHFPEFALLRRHSKPSPGNLSDLVKAADKKGFRLDASNGKELSKSLDSAVDPKNQFFNLMLRMLAVRCMKRAEYFCSGTLPKDEETLFHYGLAANIYTHFTSPIRRYADLMVHRQLSHAIDASDLHSSFLSKDRMKRICDNINYRHANAQNANRASVELNTLHYIKKCGKPLQEDGYILFVLKNAVQIFIPRLAYCANYFCEPVDEWIYDEDMQTQTFVANKAVLKRFDAVTVSLQIIDKSNEIRKGVEKIEVKFLNPLIPLQSSTNSNPKKMKVS
ncbi:exosome complex exonuclease RRP44-like protein [Leptotrombidium deliense]|uniref:Exosome complex exonuclease RRP44-like protein n=1 Tax=Leptotrombidium deliense TaxID=299467 RepID=A0A443SK35_9ACAR|nr:exosome complex exonuclease RRP44-like protein [Leptotrombidium deliense]